MLKLYYSPGACSLAPHIVLEEIGEPFEIELVSSMDGSTTTEKHLKLNPKGRVPVLTSGDLVITEVPAIMAYLALTFPYTGLLAKDALGMARSMEWMNWLSGIHASIIAQNWRVERFSDDASVYGGIQKKGLKNLADTGRLIDEKLKNLKWAVEEEFSIVDPYLLVFYRWGNRLGIDMRQFPEWTRHAESMEQRETVQSVLKTENISIWN